MGYYGHLELKQKAIKLRRKGFSYNQITAKLKVPKSTLSGWCRDVALTRKQALQLFDNKLKGAAKGRIIGAKMQQEKRLKITNELLERGKNDVGKLSRRDKFIAGISLYEAEGTKGDKSAVFTNSNAKLILFMMDWFRNFCHVSESRFRGSIWLHEGLNELKAKKYWSQLTKIPLSQFYKTYIARNKISSKKIRKNLHNYGIFSITISDKSVLRLIHGWISGVFS